MQKLAGLVLVASSHIAKCQEFAMLRQISEMFEDRREFANEHAKQPTNETDTLVDWELRSSGRKGNRDSGERKVVEMFVSFSAIQNYGCWCAFEGLLPIRGPAQDPIDTF